MVKKKKNCTLDKKMFIIYYISPIESIFFTFCIRVGIGNITINLYQIFFVARGCFILQGHCYFYWNCMVHHEYNLNNFNIPGKKEKKNTLAFPMKKKTSLFLCRNSSMKFYSSECSIIRILMLIVFLRGLDCHSHF